MRFNPDSFPYLDPGVDRRVALITGGNSGIGYYTAFHLYLHGYIVYIAGRSKSRVLKSIKSLREEAKKARSKYDGELLNERFPGDLKFLEVDLLNLSSVLRAVDTFKELESELHMLINNAGIIGVPHSLTVDNFDVQMQTNYVAPFLLTLKLLPLLERAGETGGEPPRVIYLSSIGHQFIFRYFNMNSTFDYRPNILFTWFRYGLSKTAGIHFIKLLALRNPNLLCMSVHPGFVMNTNLFSYWTRLPIIGILFWCFFQIFGFFFGVSNEEGAYATIRCCLDPSLTLERDNGKYFATGGKESTPSSVSNNMDYAARTWIWTIHQLSERNISINS